MNIWAAIDERTDKVLATFGARSEEEAEQLAAEFVAENGIDREPGYDGFYVQLDIPF